MKLQNIIERLVSVDENSGNWKEHNGGAYLVGALLPWLELIEKRAAGGANAEGDKVWYDDTREQIEFAVRLTALKKELEDWKKDKENGLLTDDFVDDKQCELQLLKKRALILGGMIAALDDDEDFAHDNLDGIHKLLVEMDLLELQLAEGNV